MREIPAGMLARVEVWFSQAAPQALPWGTSCIASALTAAFCFKVWSLGPLWRMFALVQYFGRFGISSLGPLRSKRSIFFRMEFDVLVRLGSGQDLGR